MKEVNRILNECVRNPATLQEAEDLGFIKRRLEPQYSLGILKELEETYQVSTWDVLSQTVQSVALERDVVSKWLFNYRVYVAAGGALELLACPEFAAGREDKPGAGAHPAPQSS